VSRFRTRAGVEATPLARSVALLDEPGEDEGLPERLPALDALVFGPGRRYCCCHGFAVRTNGRPSQRSLTTVKVSSPSFSAQS
jgi:hypothetical protein